MGQNRTRAIATVLLLVVAAAVPAATAAESSLDVSVDEDDTGAIAITVTDNGTAVENASVDVNAVNATYAGEGSYTTDENGTVDLPAPAENVTIEVTAEYDGATATTTVDLVVVEGDDDEGDDSGAADDSFGARVSAFVHSLLGGGDGDGSDDRGIGQAVAAWVLSHNPGNAPDHAGPPDDSNDERGRPAFAADGNESGGNETANASGAERRNAGKDRDTDHGPAIDHGENDHDRGPPAHAGPNHDDSARGEARGR